MADADALMRMRMLMPMPMLMPLPMTDCLIGFVKDVFRCNTICELRVAVSL